MKCRMAVFEERNVSSNPQVKSMVRVPVECGGDIVENLRQEPAPYPPYMPIQIKYGYYCTKCGVRYEKLPEEQP